MSIGKKLRFEVLKRDKFACQYCGKTAPDVILHVDHIQPQSKGGTDDMVNLITSCQDCNLGKGARQLSDDTSVVKQRGQLELLQERREQLEMMMEWQRSLMDMEQYAIEEVAQLWSELVPGYHLNESGLAGLRKLLAKYDVQQVCEAIRTAVAVYIEINDEGNPTHASVERSFEKLNGICYTKAREDEEPYLRDLYYIRGIVKKRISRQDKDWQILKYLREAAQNGVEIERLKELAICTTYWSQWESWMLALLRGG